MDGGVAWRKLEEGLGLEQKGSVVPDVVDHGQAILPFRLPETTAELLEPHDA